MQSKVSQILIKLTNPKVKVSDESGAAPRRRPNRAPSSSNVSCDVAAWVCDDSKVVTAQSELVKQSGTEIVEGSQIIFIWDSLTGHCLAGIAGGHKMQCPVAIPHPFDPRILCIGGADGMMKLWDIETGECFFSHKNTVDYGPVEARDRGKRSGFLDGAFSPDGLGLVLTDDSGRVTVFDCTEPHSTGMTTIPGWMKEQYFANDYYELYYDANGYCTERGSAQPPHLAPKGVRCSHGGAPHADVVNDAFKKLSGPLPIDTKQARWRRQKVAAQSLTFTRRHLSAPASIVRQFDPSTTLLISADEKDAAVAKVGRRTQSTSDQVDSPDRRPAQRLSSNYRWRDYSDMFQEQGNDDEEPDSDDEEFELNDARHSSVVEDDSDLEDVEMEDTSSAADRSRRRSRVAFDDGGSEDEFVEYMSTNNDPTGPFVNDYDSHFFRLSSRSWVVHREWLQRVEGNTSYSGRRAYAPQLGDVVVYIPRAHLETISFFPSLDAPWQNWPGEAWPVVRCCIRHVRYRFPFKAFYSNRSG